MGLGVPPRRDAAGHEGQRRALLICNGEFQHATQWNLSGVEHDAEMVQDVLEHPELCAFEVNTVVDGGFVEVRREVAKICEEAGENDTVLVYYSGQGALDSDRRLFLPVADSDPDHIYATALEPEFILGQLRRSRCRTVVLIVDACHAGAFFNGNRGIPDGLYAITSCAENELARETEAGGAFSVAVTEGLRGAAADEDGDGRVTIDELHTYVTRIAALTGAESGGQTPQKWVWNVPGPIYMTTSQRPVFLSYSRKDTEAANMLKASLEEDGFNVWMDVEDIKSGPWRERIDEGLDEARATILLMTSNSLASDIVKEEMSLSAGGGVPLIPVQIGEPEIPGWFRDRYGELQKYFLDPANPTDVVPRVAAAIRDASARAAGAAAKP